ncbi:hypothetical protein DJ69_15630 [Halorubrum persicum]|uniref:Uncharacterized protein n=1 Tax=Halorubrum persicum TaxID=1383844 RepID=A0A2G1WFA1_9EURY|nr:hypothetical protein [Halorubrum persicum]PHQ37653.1 hypothetical protein DJ69_15630 [Halorubrum persicum]
MTDRNRKQLGETPETVHVWICQIKGSTHKTTVFCDRERARTWVRARLGSDGQWRHGDWRDVYELDSEPDTGIVEFSVVEDAVGIVVEDGGTSPTEHNA